MKSKNFDSLLRGLFLTKFPLVVLAYITAISSNGAFSVSLEAIRDIYHLQKVMCYSR